MHSLKTCVRAFSMAASVAAASAPALAQPRAEDPALWPTRLVKIVVLTAPGQASDALARVLAEHFQKSLRQPVIVENRTGGAIALAGVAKGAPDGYTLVIASSGPLTVTPAVYTKLTYDPIKDFEPISNIALTPQAIMVASNGPYKTLADLIAAAKHKDLAFGIPPLGSTSHLAYAAFAKTAKVNFNLVPFKGNMESASQVIAGDVAAMYDTVPGSLGLIKAGKLRALAVAASKRSPFLPDTPTLAELGIPGSEAIGWIGLAAPTKTPPLILNKLSELVRSFLATPEAQATLKTLAFVPVEDTSRASFANTIRSELARWSTLASEADIHVE